MCYNSKQYFQKIIINEIIKDKTFGGGIRMNYNLPSKQGLYNPGYEHDNCGLGFIVDIEKKVSHKIVEDGLKILKSLKHRGAVGADEYTGDGAGIMVSMPHQYFKRELKNKGVNLPSEGSYGVGMLFLPRDPNISLICEGIIESLIVENQMDIICWRDVPINSMACGELANATRPKIMQVFVKESSKGRLPLENKLYLLRKKIENEIRKRNNPFMKDFYICSFSQYKVIYKGQILGHMLDDFYFDLHDDEFKVFFALVHERYSTNTFPSWKLAQPFRFIAHNGEINTIKGNRNWMKAREGVMESKLYKEDFKDLIPTIDTCGSDSASLDNAAELFHMNSHPLEYAMMIMIPEPWENNDSLSDDLKAFYEYHSRVMEPWDGPATIAFFDGNKVGMIVDRNGLRPARYTVTKDNQFVFASEAGVLKFDGKNIKENGIVTPGNIVVIDTHEHKIFTNNEVKDTIAGSKPFLDWVNRNRCELEKTEIKEPKLKAQKTKIRKKVFNYDNEEIKSVITPMVLTGKEAIGSMGQDTPLPMLSSENQLFFNYFRQKFAQVTNPPIDSIREKSVMSLTQFVGFHGKILDELETDLDKKYLRFTSPILNNEEMKVLKNLDDDYFRTTTIPILFQPDIEDGLTKSIDALCIRIEEVIKRGYNIVVLSDKNCDMYNAPIPSLLALSMIHQHLVDKKLRTEVDLVVETGACRDVMHMSLLMGYGAKLINPYMAYYIIDEIHEEQSKNDEEISIESLYENYKESINRGMLKIMSRMGISTLRSYQGSQNFEIIGLDKELVAKFFPDTPSVLSGVGLKEIKDSILSNHNRAYYSEEDIKNGGYYKNIKGGERHLLTTDFAKSIFEGSRDNDQGKIVSAFEKIDNKKSPLLLRDLMDFKYAKEINLDEVEDKKSILSKFTVEGMSFGSISRRAHEDIAKGVNTFGGKSNSGEGGEDPERFSRNEDGASLSSKIKQVASGRFGVTLKYLSNATELQIKIAQGAKPGEGGHLPGHKITSEIAKVRHSEEGIDLISPPPHHDIYSIEDLAQLIFDLKNVNESSDICVKLVSQTGIGTVASGVAKAHSDKILISGYDGGTGASPISSMRYVGLPWEIGLSEVQQTLLLNDLRGRVKLRVDGKLFTAKDIVIATMLGAEEFGFASVALMSLGCIMCRNCHKNICPVGIATQDEKLQKKYKGSHYNLVNYFTILAENVRELLSKIGVKSLDEIVGRTDLITFREGYEEEFEKMSISEVLYRPELPSRISRKYIQPQNHGLKDALDKKIISSWGKNIIKEDLNLSYKIENTDRSFGTMISGYMEKHDSQCKLTVKLRGSAGQSLGAFLHKNISIYLEGEANDYLAKGLSGGKIVINNEYFTTEDKSTIIGNTALYGATSGQVYIKGRAGHRFAVRNSGATAVVEGLGNHGCEYMTGGTILVLGDIGENLCAGMSGGVIYLHDPNNEIDNKINKEFVDVYKADQHDYDNMKSLMEKHLSETNSDTAKKLLEKWESKKEEFIVIKRA